MDFHSILVDLGVPTAPEGHHHTRPGWVNFDCPFCNKTGKFHMGYNQSRKYLHCWICGPQRIVATLSALGMDPKQARKAYHELDAEFVTSVIKPQGKLVLPKRLGPLLKPHKRYLKRRGFSPARIARLWGVQGIPQASRLSWRLFLPIYWQGNLVSWTTRAINENVQARYISASAMEESIPHKSILYGADYTTHSVIIHEGPLDVWATGPGSVGTLGLRVTRSQEYLLSSYPRRVVCFDKSRQAQERAFELCDALSVFPGETINVCLETGKDPAEADEAELKELRESFL